MTARHFWRRAFAYLLDLFILGFVITVIIIAYNSIFSTRFLAPELLTTSACAPQFDMIPQERMDEILPLEPGQQHQQFLCKQTNMLANSFHIAGLQKIWQEGNVTRSVSVSYYSDEHGNQKTYFSSEPFFYLLAPLVFALFLAKMGQTPGKRLFKLTVYNNALQKPDLMSALKREYFKATVLIIIALFSLYSLYQAVTLDLEVAGKQAQDLLNNLGGNFWLWIVGGVVISIAAFWFEFGSFIRWRGRTYWDQFADLTTSKTNDLDMRKAEKIISDE
ncbi:RDD family protein [Pseudovibrio sp. JE062]|uniref:RDD family protein n=1 Tax=Pseudovibrio sp. JE062 TaxID=439495 RepID=UPI000186C46D|nr:RDD family protein [Pseudovibrio sp. JE062]EEA92961.1 RDD family, putative [Pseudovibrio sp. JE062]